MSSGSLKLEKDNEHLPQYQLTTTLYASTPEIHDPQEVPPEYCKPDTAKIKKALSANKSIPGASITHAVRVTLPAASGTTPKPKRRTAR